MPIFEAFYLKLETHYKRVVLAKFARNGDDERTDDSAVSRIYDIARNARFIPDAYASVIEKARVQEGNLEKTAHMLWLCTILRHVRSFASFSFRKFVAFRDANYEPSGVTERRKVRRREGLRASSNVK